MIRPFPTLTFVLALMAGSAICLPGPGLSSLAESKSKEKSKEWVEEFSGTYLDLATSGDQSAQAVIRVKSWTTDDEVQSYAKTLAEDGQMELLEVFSKIDIGFIRIGGSLGYPIAVARSIKTETGRTVVLISQRPFAGFALSKGLRGGDFPFGVVEIKLDAKGKGEGQIIGAAQIGMVKDGTVEIRGIGTQPSRLLGVTAKQ